MRNVRSALVTAALSILVPAAAFANHSAATAAPQGINARPTAFTLSAGQPEGWFYFVPTVGRSYCLEVTKGEFELKAADSVVALYRQDTTTFLGDNNNSDSEPNLLWGSRFCFVQQLAEWDYVQVYQTGGSSGVTTNYEFRIIDTTQFSPFWQVATAAGYDAAPQIRNNTSDPIDVFFKAYNAAGVPLPGCPTTAITIPGNGMTTFGVSSRCGTSSAFGSAQIAHTGSPGAISANITTFSASSGLSFDAPFTPRQDYRH